MLINLRKGESYQHAAARTVFMEWLRQSNGIFGPFYWYGAVHEEYPFIVGISEPVQNMLSTIPSYEEIIAAGMHPVAIADIAIEHKGMIVYAIEIVHKHDVSENKIANLLSLQSCVPLEVWRVEAHWILSQIGKPDNFPEVCIRNVSNNKASTVTFEEAMNWNKTNER